MAGSALGVSSCETEPSTVVMITCVCVRDCACDQRNLQRDTMNA
jgi:hypothetical protein